MHLSCTQIRFVKTLRQLSFRESSVFKIGYDEAIQVITNSALYRHQNVNKILNNALGWLKYYDRQHPEDHERISSLIYKTFGPIQQSAFDEGYIGVDPMLPIDFLFRAIELRNVEDVKFVLKNETFNLNATRDLKDGETPLTLACQLGHVEVVKELLANSNIDPNRFNQGWTSFPLYIAVNNGFTDVVRELLKHPAIDPNLQSEAAYAPVILAIFYGHAEILDLLSKHPKTNLHFVRRRHQVTPMHDIVRFGSPELKSMGQRTYSINPKNEETEKILWTTFSILPVSCDQTHKPPADYFEGLSIVDLKLFRNDRYGELEIHHKRDWTRVIYRTHEYMTISLLRQNRPLGLTIYKPFCDDALEIRGSSDIWHIANKAISNHPEALHEILSDLADKKFIVLRSIEVHDVKRILSKQTLKGPGISTDVAVQVRGDKTALVSASFQPISKFLNGHKGKKNGGYVAIFTEKGARLFLDFRGPYPKFLSHREVLEEVSHDRGLIKRAIRAKECIFYPGVPLDLVAVLDGGYPTISGKKQNKEKITTPLPMKIEQFLKKRDISYEALPSSLQTYLHSNKSIKNKMRAVMKYNREMDS